jgi:hypothetical protein
MKYIEKRKRGKILPSTATPFSGMVSGTRKGAEAIVNDDIHRLGKRNFLTQRH